MSWDHKNPEKHPIPTPTCFGTAEPCQECGNCWLYNDCEKSRVEVMTLEAKASRMPITGHEPEWLSEALNEGDGVYRP